MVVETTAISALGHIGDTSALPALEAIRGTPTKGARHIPSGRPTGLARYAALAIAAINSGGNSLRGIEQPTFLTSSDRFYALTK